MAEQESLLAGFKSMIDDIHERVYKLKIFDHTEIVNAYCDDLECQVILTVESAVKSLERIQEEWIKEIQRYRTALLKPKDIDLELIHLLPKFKEIDLAKTDRDLQELLAQTEQFRLKWTSMLPDINADLIASGRNDADALKVKIKGLEREMRRQAFKGQFMRFDENPMLTFDRDLIGKLRCFEAEPLGPIETKKPECSLKHSMAGHEKYLIDVLFLADDKLATSGVDKKLKIWSIENGELLHNLTVYSGDLVSLSLLPNGHLATGTRDAVINIWDTSKPKIVKVLSGHSRVVSSLSVLENGNLASLSADGTIRIWNPYLNHERTHILTICYSDWSLIVCAFGVLSFGYLVSVAIDEHYDVLKMWNPKDGRLVRIMKTSLIRVTFLLVLANDNVLLASRNGTVHIYNVIEQTMLRTLEIGNDNHQYLSFIQLSNGYLLGARSRNCAEIRVWNPETGELIEQLQTVHQVAAMSVNKDGRYLATGATDGTVKIWSLDFK